MNLKDRTELVGKLLGVEIEYYPTRHDHAGNDDLELESKHDGSLDAGGRELTALTWATDGTRLRHLLGLNLRGRVNKKCGLHVHVDARHLGTNGLLNAADTYDKCCKFFKHLRALCPPSRKSNKYCMWVNNRPGSADFHEPRNGLRYAAINFSAYSRYKTIEFRCQGGSVNVYKIEMWALFCQHLVNWCAQPSNEITPKYQHFDYFLTIFPEPFCSWAFMRKQSLAGAQQDLVRIAAALDQEVEA